MEFLSFKKIQKHHKKIIQYRSQTYDFVWAKKTKIKLVSENIALQWDISLFTQLNFIYLFKLGLESG